MYGHPGRIGLLVADGKFCMEPEFHRMAPDGVVTLAARVALKDVNPDSLLDMKTHTAQAARAVAQARVGVVAFGCTSGSFVGGSGYDAGLVEIMEEATGCPATTTTTAVLRALKLLNVSRIALATPYTDELTRLEVKFLEDSGFEVTAWEGGGITGVADIQECEPEVSYKRALGVDSDRAEAIFISCTGFRTIENIEALEKELGKPVISSNQATFADCLRILGVEQVQPGYGSLFERVFSMMSQSDGEALIAAGGD